MGKEIFLNSGQAFIKKKKKKGNFTCEYYLNQLIVISQQAGEIWSSACVQGVQFMFGLKHLGIMPSDIFFCTVTVFIKEQTAAYVI